MGRLAEMLVLESTLPRTEKMAGTNKSIAVLLAKYSTACSLRVLESAAEQIIGAASGDSGLGPNMEISRCLSQHRPTNIVQIGREISAAMVAAGQYSLSR